MKELNLLNFLTKKNHLLNLKKQMPDLLNENFEDDQYFKLMPTSFQLSLKNFEDAKSIKNSLQSKSGVEEIYLSEDFFEKYFKLRTGVEVLSIVIAIIMIVFLGLIIQNSIQQMIWIQSEEIAIKEMFGASKKFIQKPIYIEVGLINLVSSLISICISFDFILHFF
jgi:cell division protein FtsX